jgi:hypothetical protein
MIIWLPSCSVDQGEGSIGLTESITSALFFKDGEDCDLTLSNRDVFAFLQGGLGDHNSIFYCM